MPFLSYPAAQAVLDLNQSFDDAQIQVFNNYITEIQKTTVLGQNYIETMNLEVFVKYGIEALLAAQGYTVTAVGFSPIIKYRISWQ